MFTGIVTINNVRVAFEDTNDPNETFVTIENGKITGQFLAKFNASGKVYFYQNRYTHSYDPIKIGQRYHSTINMFFNIDGSDYADYNDNHNVYGRFTKLQGKAMQTLFNAIAKYFAERNTEGLAKTLEKAKIDREKAITEDIATLQAVITALETGNFTKYYWEASRAIDIARRVKRDMQYI